MRLKSRSNFIVPAFELYGIASCVALLYVQNNCDLFTVNLRPKDPAVQWSVSDGNKVSQSFNAGYKIFYRAQ